VLQPTSWVRENEYRFVRWTRRERIGLSRKKKSAITRNNHRPQKSIGRIWQSHRSGSIVLLVLETTCTTSLYLHYNPHINPNRSRRCCCREISSIQYSSKQRDDAASCIAFRTKSPTTVIASIDRTVACFSQTSLLELISSLLQFAFIQSCVSSLLSLLEATVVSRATDIVAAKTVTAVIYLSFVICANRSHW